MTPIHLIDRAGEWEFTPDPPADWSDAMRRTDAGFFHAPIGLLAGAPEGEPIFARYRWRNEDRGIAVGVRTRCRLSDRPRHAYFATWPAFRSVDDRETGMPRLGAMLRAEGIAEVRWDSFDASCTTAPARTPTRSEFLLDLGALDASGIWPPASGHRRAIRRGDREGWELREVSGPAAAGVLEAVMQRVAERGIPGGVQIPAVARSTVATPEGTAVVWTANHGGELLAGALIGVSATRAFYVMGGSTAAGYAVGASIWLHARIAKHLAGIGKRYYNLGGVPAGAERPEAAAHGLYRFKRGFGAVEAPCAGDRWVLAPSHERGHALLRWVTRAAG